jgi:preprotein translocase subunit SecA
MTGTAQIETDELDEIYEFLVNAVPANDHDRQREKAG